MNENDLLAAAHPGAVLDPARAGAHATAAHLPAATIGATHGSAVLTVVE